MSDPYEDVIREKQERDYDDFLDGRFNSIREAIEYMAEHPDNGYSLLRAEWAASLEN